MDVFDAEKISTHGGSLRVNACKRGAFPISENISKILKEKGLYTNPDLKNVEEKLKRIEKHAEKNKQDKRAIRERSRVFSHVRKIKKYNKLI